MDNTPPKIYSEMDVDHLKENNNALRAALEKEHTRATTWMVLFWATWMLIVAVSAFHVLVKVSNYFWPYKE